MSIDIYKKPVKVLLGEDEYDFSLDFESAIAFQDLYKKSIFVGMKKITEEQDIKALGYLIASCLKKDGKVVGLKFVNKLDLMASLPIFTEKLDELISNSLPEVSEEDKKKE